MEIEYDGTYLSMRGEASHRQIKLDEDQMIDICAAFARWNRLQSDKRQEEWEKRQLAKGEVWTINVFWPDRAEKYVHYTWDDAIAAVYGVRESKEALVQSVLCPDGTRLAGQALRDEVLKWEMQYDDER